MKKLLILVPSIVAMLVFSSANFVQAQDATSEAPAKLTVASIIAEPDAPYAQPFGYPPYPTVEGMPAYGVPYSYPRVRKQRRVFSRLAPPAHQPYPLPAVGMPVTMGTMPAAQDMPGTIPAATYKEAMAADQPTVFYRPTPVRNFMALIVSPRPYVGYDPYAAYPPQQ